MTRSRTLLLLGILVALSPFIGLPLSVLAWILPILGLLIIIAGRKSRTSAPVHEKEESVG